MPSKKSVFSYLIFLILLAGCSSEKESIPKPQPVSKIFDASFLNRFKQGWIFAFLQKDKSSSLKEMIQQNAGWQALFEGKISEAATSFSSSEDIPQKTGRIRVLLEKANFYQENYQLALLYQKDFLTYREKNSNIVKPSLYLVFYLGKNKLLSGEYQKAITDFNYLLQKKASPAFHTRAQILLGAAYYLKGETAKASSLWEEAKKDKETQNYFKSEWGFIQGYLGLSLEKGLAAAQEAYQAVKDKSGAEKNYFLFNLMYLKLLNGQIAEAQKSAAKFPWGEPEYSEYIDPEFSLKFYNPFYLSFLSSLDLDLCEEILENNGSLPYHNYYAGQLFFQKKDYVRSETAFSAFLQSKPALDLPSAVLSPLNTEDDFLIAAQYTLGEIFFQKKQTEEAHQLWQKTFKSYSNNPLTWLYQAEVQANYLDQKKEALSTALAASSSRKLLESELLASLTFEEQDNLASFLPFYLAQYSRRTAAIMCEAKQVLAAIDKLVETNDKQLGYNTSGQNNPRFLLQLAQAYYKQNRFNEVVGIYFCLLKDFPPIKQNYEVVKSIYATTTDSGETPR